MPFKSYLVQQFKKTHENEFFDVVVNSLKQEYEKQPNLTVLIGNFGCGGNQIDAMFITRGKCIIIEFKHYSGILTASENKPWTITNNNNTIVVMGGRPDRNPFQQIRDYKDSIVEHLQQNQKNILGQNSQINWTHINGLVAFSKDVTYEQLNVYWFRISDRRSYINQINFINSIFLNFTDQEIENILTSFDIEEQHLYPKKNNQHIVGENQNNNFSENKEIIADYSSENNSVKKTKKFGKNWKVLISSLIILSIVSLSRYFFFQKQNVIPKKLTQENIELIAFSSINDEKIAEIIQIINKKNSDKLIIGFKNDGSGRKEIYLKSDSIKLKDDIYKFWKNAKSSEANFPKIAFNDIIREFSSDTLTSQTSIFLAGKFPYLNQKMADFSSLSKNKNIKIYINLTPIKLGDTLNKRMIHVFKTYRINCEEF